MRPIPSFLFAAAILLGACRPAAAALPVQGVQVKATYPHDARAFTQGLLFLNGDLYESTGLVGQSTIRRVRLKDGAVLQSKAVSPSVFGEGLVNWGDELISITWRDQVGFRWDRRTFALKSSYKYAGEGWALTQNGKQIIMSDGTPVLKFLDPKTLKEVRRVNVTAEGRPVANLNEIEWVKGEVWANVWMTRYIARIDPQTGAVRGWIDLAGLPEVEGARNPDAVPNGIAYDAAGERLFLTGKLWPHLYEVRLTPAAK